MAFIPSSLRAALPLRRHPVGAPVCNPLWTTENQPGSKRPKRRVMTISMEYGGKRSVTPLSVVEQRSWVELSSDKKRRRRFPLAAALQRTNQYRRFECPACHWTVKRHKCRATTDLRRGGS